MRYLGLDLGRKRTGIAFADSTDDILFSLMTIEGKTEEELVECISALVSEKMIDELVVGLPLLPSGKAGSQAQWVESVIIHLKTLGIPVSVLDERYTTGKRTDIDQDAAAACQILSVKLSRNTHL